MDRQGGRGWLERQRLQRAPPEPYASARMGVLAEAVMHTIVKSLSQSSRNRQSSGDTSHFCVLEFWVLNFRAIIIAQNDGS